MDLFEVVDNMSIEMYERLKHAAETGKWPEGTPVDKAQRDSALQLAMAYQSRHLNSDDILTIGSDGGIVHKTKAQLKKQFKQAATAEASDSNDDIARFTNL
ncbi:DUF1315 family protein [Thalassotalea psychrophila]|uniref:DUF1315 family protein n=1 Tax=Thalassotalea psychrophila TaxID=3065647 RepID=A0ABY9TP12_9GAMM|nr:DUF1315 family protein [Colwelliaceae bacterium SQ149]